MLRTVLVVCLALCCGSWSFADERSDRVGQRKRSFLIQLADGWARAGYPIAWKHAEWKHNEIEPNWAGALAAMTLKRSSQELAKANTFFQAMPLDEKIDPDMRVCEVLHTYYLFRDDPDLTSASRKHLLELARFEPAPIRINPSIWKFGATENHAFMGHVWRLLTAQIDRDHKASAQIAQHIDTYIIEHIRKGWLEYNSPCYVEKEVGCLLMIAEWAEDPVLRAKATLGLDVLFAEHAALNLEGMLCGPACRVYRPGHEGILSDELGHNSRRDAKCSGSYPLMYMLFGQGGPHFYGVLGAPLLATSRYVPPAAVDALATPGPYREAYAFKARRPGHGHGTFRHDPQSDYPPPDAFDARIYAWVTPDFVLGSFQEVQGVYGAARSLPLTSVLRMAGGTRRAVYTNLLLGTREEVPPAVVDCAQHKNVSMGRGILGEAYLAVDEFDEVIEQDGWIFIRAGTSFAAYRVAGAGYQWQKMNDDSVFGDFLKFDRPDAPFILEAAQADDYAGDFKRFQADVADNRVEPAPEGLTYESCSKGDRGPSAEAFTLTLRYGALPLVNGQPMNLKDYGTFESPYLNSAWDSGIVKLQTGRHRLTINVKRAQTPARTEEEIAPLALPYETDCDNPDNAWRPFLNYWRLKPEQWYWHDSDGQSGGCLRHEASLGVRDPARGAHDAAIILRGGETWTDYGFEADAYAERGHFGLWVRADMQDEGAGNGRWVQGYYFVLDPSHHKCRLWRARQDGLPLADDSREPTKTEENHFSNPLPLTEAQLPESVAYGRWLKLRVEVRGHNIKCFVDGQPVLDATDGLYSAGSVGLTVYKGRDVRFDNIRVTANAK